MKKLFQKINTKATRSVVFGLILAVSMSAGTTFVLAQYSNYDGGIGQQTLRASDFVKPSASLVSRIGSLTIGSSSVASWITSPFGSADCIHAGNGGGFKTCLDVSGGGIFKNLIVKQTANVLGYVTVSKIGDFGGVGGFVGSNPAFLIEDMTSVVNDSLLVQGLARTALVNTGSSWVLSPNPIDYTTEREVCADIDGTLQICTGGAIGGNTYSWNTGIWGTCTGSSGSCSGSWTETSASCTGTYSTTDIINEVDWNGSPFNWNLNQDYETGYSGYDQCRIYTVTSCNSSGCDWQYDQYEFDLYGFNNGIGASGQDPTCGFEIGDPAQSTNNAAGPAATVVTNNNSCTGLVEQSCISQAYDGCVWSSSGTTTYQCSGPTTSLTCTSQNAACSWSATSGTQDRTVQCIDQDNNIVADSLCITNVGAAPVSSQTC